MIDIANLAIRRGGASVLQDITLRIPQGGIVAIIGPNGAGKSTLLHCMAGLLAPDTGTVRIDGEDIHALGEADRALLVSLLTQSPGAVPRLSVGDLVGFGRWPHHRGRPGKEDENAIAEAIRRFDLHDILSRDVETLSGGQKQRAFVAMAYAQTTPWMFLDEPLAALDPKFTRDIMDRLKSVTSGPTASRSVALVLHDLQIAARDADWIICLKKGRLVRSGTRDDTLTSEVLTNLYDTPLTLRSVDGKPVVMPG